MAKKQRAKGFTIKLYPTYGFKGQDPAVAKVLESMPNSNRSKSGKAFSEASKKSGVSVSTLRNWKSGKTSRPQFCTLQAAAIANGKRFVLADDNRRKK